MLICILHDFGKSRNLVSELNFISTDTHEHNSAKYSKFILKKFTSENKSLKKVLTSATRQIIFQTLYQHHKNCTIVEESIFRKILLLSDIGARKRELEELREED